MLWNRRSRQPWLIQKTNHTYKQVEQKGQRRTKTGAALLLFGGQIALARGLNEPRQSGKFRCTAEAYRQLPIRMKGAQ
jgi:hypothetical protein